MTGPGHDIVTPLQAAFSPELLAALERLVDQRVDERVSELERSSAMRPLSEFLTIPEAADLLRCRRGRVDDLLSAGRIPRVKEGSRTLLRRSDLDAYLNDGGERRRR
jgi:excisionase family DNA binding protein